MKKLFKKNPELFRNNLGEVMTPGSILKQEFIFQWHAL